MFGIHVRKRRAVAAGAIVLAAATLAGCSGSGTGSGSGSTATGSAAAKTVTIGFSPYNQSAPALIGLAKGFSGMAKAQGAQALIADPNNSATKQEQQIQSWMELGQVQAVWALALNPSVLKPLVTLAASKKVAVLLAGTPADYGVSAPTTNVSFSAIDYKKFGQLEGEQLGKCANERLGGKGVFVYLAADPGSVGKAQQDAAIVAALAATSPGSKIVSTQTFGGVQLKAQQLALSAIQANPGLNGAIGGTDESTLGPLTAFTQAGKDTSKLCIVGGGGNTAALADVKAGKIYADVAIQFDADLAQNVNLIIKMAKHLGSKGVQLYTPLKTVTK